MVEILRYNLRCFGIPIEGPAEVTCDNKSVVINPSVPTSMLNKRHNTCKGGASSWDHQGWVDAERA